VRYGSVIEWAASLIVRATHHPDIDEARSAAERHPLLFHWPRALAAVGMAE
jgi:hypothetical protein